MPDQHNDTVEFLKLLRPRGPWVLSAIVPDGAIETITAKTEGDISAFVSKHSGKRNLYYSVNPTRTALTRKAAKTDIAAIEYLPADLDPKANEPSEAKARFLAELEQLQPAPTAIVDSGNGIQVLMKLAAPIALAEPVITTDKDGKAAKVFPEETAKQVADIENRVKLLMETLGSVAGTQNIDRILRLPGTINLPNAKKLREGRGACPTRLIKFNGATCTLDDFPDAAGPQADSANTGTGTNSAGAGNAGSAGAGSAGAGNAGAGRQSADIDWAKVDQHAGWLTGVDVLPMDFSLKGRMIVAHGGNICDLNFDLRQAGLLTKPYGTWSAVSFALAAIFKNDGRFSNEQIADALMCDLECNHHITKMKDGNAKRRAVERLIQRSHDMGQQAMARAAGAPDWRERRLDGSPIPSMHNARLAITAIGVECSYDTFHDKMLFGYADDTTRHIVAQILGDVSDNGILSLRRLLSDRFGFDLTDKHVRDAVISLALEHCFDPVADMLAEAKANWDGVERLNRMAPDYLSCEDMPLNRACVRKTMIAAVARVRQPGCKFDTILVLESPEGFNKSTAWKVLAGEENFSDEKIIGKESREVQEQLSAVWIHENADLAGLKKTEVETVKAFASRQIDRARPAYGHFLRKQPRHSIEIGTTNSSEYLQSQTGNRRFWPMLVLKAIDLEKLKRDRLQLWGEAAHYQSKGESLTLDESMWAAAGVEQEKRRVKDPWEAVLTHIPEVVEDKKWDDKLERYVTTNIHFIINCVGDQERVATSEILAHVLNVPIAQQTTAHTMRLANVMKVLGWQRASNGKVSINGHQMRGYFRWVDQPADGKVPPF